jgi:hypothetical protein
MNDLKMSAQNNLKMSSTMQDYFNEKEDVVLDQENEKDLMESQEILP